MAHRGALFLGVERQVGHVLGLLAGPGPGRRRREHRASRGQSREGAPELGDGGLAGGRGGRLKVSPRVAVQQLLRRAYYASLAVILAGPERYTFPKAG